MTDPGTPDHRGPAGYLRWVLGTQAGSIAFATVAMTLWQGAQAVLPAVVGAAVDAGLTRGEPPALAGWAGLLMAVGCVQAVLGVVAHRASVFNWCAATYRSAQVVADRAARLGAALTRRIPSGEVVAVGAHDIDEIGELAEHTGYAVSSAVVVAAVGGWLLYVSPPFGLLVVIGVPLMMLGIGPLMRPLQRRQHGQRELQSKLSSRAVDIVSGLRVLRGVGGESLFGARYREESQAVRAAGERVGRSEALLQAVGTLLPGLLTVAVIWLGARLALAGEITPGQLVAFYGYAGYLAIPVHFLTDMVRRYVAARVAAGRVVRILALPPDRTEPRRPAPGPSGPAALYDAGSGVRIEPGVVTAVAGTDPDDMLRLAERLGGYEPGRVDYGGTDLAELSEAELRRRILVADNDAWLFPGTLRTELDPGAAGPEGEARVRAAVHAACADDIVAALPAGLDGAVTDRGREFSGGQQQRLRLARALLADPEVLVLVEPASAVDAHTEAAVAERLGRARAGRTTVVLTTSPLLLARADRVVFVSGGRARASGRHGELLRTEPEYARTVTRGAEPS